MATDWVEGDSKTVLQATCKDQDGAVIDLTGFSAKLFYRINNAPLLERTMTVYNAAAGVLRYQFTAQEMLPGMFEGEIKIYDGNDQLTGGGIITKRIRKAL